MNSRVHPGVEKPSMLRTRVGCCLQCNKRQVRIGSNVVDGEDLLEASFQC